MSKFSEFLYSLRKEKQLTQTELAEQLGITNKAVSKWETGEAMPDTAQLLPLSEILGVSVDELLRGERNGVKAENGKEREQAEPAPHGDRIVLTSGSDTVEIESDGSVLINNLKAQHNRKTLLEKISGCVCAALMAAGVIAYVTAGLLTGMWHPLWCIIASAALGCGIVGGVFDLFDGEKKSQKRKKGENPYTGSICGIVMCVSLIVFLCVASVCDLWSVMWIAPAAGVCVCIVVGTLGGTFNGKDRERPKP
ncbi:MAG: helix-turn-helix domain-containing protein [Clostridia bacterium]|nr:helix-turn-helix domain-containing protein [Clostridia bacterium]